MRTINNVHEKTIVTPQMTMIKDKKKNKTKTASHQVQAEYRSIQIRTNF